jgi:hypothetical protein
MHFFLAKDKEMWYIYEGKFAYEPIIQWAETHMTYVPVKTEL